MKFTHYGHACVLIEFLSTDDQSTRLLIDPGVYSAGFEKLRDLDGILITHPHPDHLDVDRVARLLTNNPHARTVADTASATLLLRSDISAEIPEDRESFDIGGVSVQTWNGAHGCIHPDLPKAANNGYVFNGTVLHPGDTFDNVPSGIEILLLPISGPWMKFGESIDFLRTVSPRVVVPIHEAVLTALHQKSHCQLLEQLAPDGCAVAMLRHGVPELV